MRILDREERRALDSPVIRSQAVEAQLISADALEPTLGVLGQ